MAKKKDGRLFLVRNKISHEPLGVDGEWIDGEPALSGVAEVAEVIREAHSRGAVESDSLEDIEIFELVRIPNAKLSFVFIVDLGEAKPTAKKTGDDDEW